MSACLNCGASCRPTDKFCNTCGSPVTASPGAPPPYPPPQGWGAAPPAPRCQMGHEVPPGQNYCPQGHPIALEQVQFAPSVPQGSQYGATPGAGYPPQQGGAKYAQAGANIAPNYSGSGSGSGSYGTPPAYPPQAPQPYPGATPPAGYGAPSPPTGYTPPPVAAPYNPPPSPPADELTKAAAEPTPAAGLGGFIVSYQLNPVGEFWPLHGPRMTIGRASSGETVDIALADATISSRHAVLHIDAGAGTVAVEDTGSTNGTFVNDEHLGFSGRRELRDGDRLRLGGFSTIVKIITRP